MKKITVNNNQSIWDIALQEYGDASGVKQLRVDNPEGCDFENPIAKGTQLLIDETKIINPSIVAYYEKKKYKPTTAGKKGAMAFSSGFNKGFN